MTDNLSNCTAASTASLASRLASLAVHYPATTQRTATEEAVDEEGEGGGQGSACAPPSLSSSSSSDEDGPANEEEEEVEVVELTEEQVLGLLDGLEPAWAVAGRLFLPRPPPPAAPPLKALTWASLDALRTRGYAVVDGLLTPEESVALRSCVLAARDAGALMDAASAAAGAAYRAAPGARSDAIAWLPGGDPTSPPSHPALDSPAMTAARRVLAAVAEDVGRAVRLALPAGVCGEVQVALYPPGGRYVRHRDSLPDDGEGEEEGDGQRRVTVVLYANPGWEPESGGKLRLWPPVGPGEDEDEDEDDEQEEGVAPLSPSPSAKRPLQGGVGGPSSVVAEPTEAAASDAATEAATSVAGWGGKEAGGGGGGGGGGVPTPARPVAAALPDVTAQPPSSPAPPSVTTASPGRGGNRAGGRGNNNNAAGGVGTAEMGPEAAVDVAPLAGRAVLFMSGVVEHAVLAAGVERVAVTGWLR